MIALHTERLLIRDHKKEDFEGLYRLVTDEKAMYFLDDLRARSSEDAWANLEVAMGEAKKSEGERECYFFTIALKASSDETQESGSYVGEIGYTVKARTSQGKLVEMGYFILPEFWNQGIVTEAVDRVMKFAFEENGVWKIELGCNKGNLGSERVMIKSGMTKEGELVDHTWLDNRLWNRVCYRMLKTEWADGKFESKNGQR